jgi:hypothetical protein
MPRTAQTIANDIAAWDRQNITVLRDLIAELSAACEDTEEFIDMSALPTAAIPTDIDTTFPVWAVDVHGNALVGNDARDIQTLDQVRAAQ